MDFLLVETQCHTVRPDSIPQGLRIFLKIDPHGVFPDLFEDVQLVHTPLTDHPLCPTNQRIAPCLQFVGHRGWSVNASLQFCLYLSSCQIFLVHFWGFSRNWTKFQLFFVNSDKGFLLHFCGLWALLSEPVFGELGRLPRKSLRSDNYRFVGHRRWSVNVSIHTHRTRYLVAFLGSVPPDRPVSCEKN